MNKEFCLFKVDEKRVIWEVTKYCNYKCKHCCASANLVDTKDELSKEECIDILKQLKDFGIKEIYFSGGEPFSRSDMLDILKFARKLDICCNISTNGSYLTESIVKQLEELKLNKVHISLDSNCEKDFNRFRGGDYFEPTINSIKLLKKYNIYVRVGTVIWKENYQKLEEMIQFLILLGVDEVVFNWLVKVGRLKENNDVCVDIQYFDNTVKQINEFKKKYKNLINISMHRSECFENSNDICPAGETFFYIDPQGFVSPCSWIKKMDSKYTSVNSLKDMSFNEIIKEENIQVFNKLKYKRMKEYKAGCPAICLERNGTYFSKDPLLLENKEECII